MMIAVKDVQMPDRCWNCRFLGCTFDFESRCGACGRLISDEDLHSQERPDWCPLCEVKEASWDRIISESEQAFDRISPGAAMRYLERQAGEKIADYAISEGVVDCKVFDADPRYYPSGTKKFSARMLIVNPKKPDNDLGEDCSEKKNDLGQD